MRENGQPTHPQRFAAWRRSPTGLAAGWAVVVLLAACYFLFQVKPLIGDLDTGIPGLSAHQNDYKHIYLGSRLLAEGLSPYDSETMRAMAGGASAQDPRFRSILPYVYLPFTGLVMYPLATMPFAQSALAFQFLNHLFLLGGMMLAALGAGWRRDGWTAALLLLLAAFNTAVFRQNNAGQLNAVLLLGMGLLFLAIARRWHSAAIGTIAAFLMLFKLSPGIFLIYFLIRKEWHRALWMIGASAVMMTVSVLVFGLDRHLEFISVLKNMGYGKSTWSELGQTFWRDPYNQSFNALFHRLLVPHAGSPIQPWLRLSPAIANGLTWLASLTVLFITAWALWRSRALKAADEAAPLALAICASLLLPSILWDHYLTQLIIPAILLISCRRTPVTIIALASIALSSLPIALDSEANWQGFRLLVMSVKSVPAMACFAAAAWAANRGAR